MMKNRHIPVARGRRDTFHLCFLMSPGRHVAGRRRKQETLLVRALHLCGRRLLLMKLRCLLPNARVAEKHTTLELVGSASVPQDAFNSCLSSVCCFQVTRKTNDMFLCNVGNLCACHARSKTKFNHCTFCQRAPVANQHIIGCMQICFLRLQMFVRSRQSLS